MAIITSRDAAHITTMNHACLFASAILQMSLYNIPIPKTISPNRLFLDIYPPEADKSSVFGQGFFC